VRASLGVGVIAAMSRIRRWSPLFHDEYFCKIISGWPEKGWNPVFYEIISKKSDDHSYSADLHSFNGN